MPKSHQAKFNDELANMLKEARTGGCSQVHCIERIARSRYRAQRPKPSHANGLYLNVPPRVTPKRQSQTHWQTAGRCNFDARNRI